jgi:hypothetical protein
MHTSSPPSLIRTSAAPEPEELTAYREELRALLALRQAVSAATSRAEAGYYRSLLDQQYSHTATARRRLAAALRKAGAHR